MPSEQPASSPKVVKLSSEKAHQDYRLKDGRTVPGATTVLGVIDKSKPLMHWAWKMGKDGLDYRKVRDKAADIGSVAHFMVECFLNGWKPDLSDYSSGDIAKAGYAMEKFTTFWSRRSFKVVATEAQLVSERYLYGGTLDLVAEDSLGLLWLFDWKTSKAIYSSYKRQYAAYAELWNENNERKIEEGRIVRIGKEVVGDCEIVDPGATGKYFKTFLAATRLWYSLKDEGWDEN